MPQVLAVESFIGPLHSALNASNTSKPQRGFIATRQEEDRSKNGSPRLYFLKQGTTEKLPTNIIEAQATIVILAGSETSSVAETAAVYHMSAHPDIYKKLQAEITTVFERIEDITLQNVLSKPPYLDAVVQKTLRIHAPLANGFTRLVVPDKNSAIIWRKHIAQGVSTTWTSQGSVKNLIGSLIKFTDKQIVLDGGQH